MEKVWTPPVRLVFGAATVLGCFSTLQVYRLSTLNPSKDMPIEVGRHFLLNLSYWYVAAAITPVVFKLSDRFRSKMGARPARWQCTRCRRGLFYRPCRLHDQRPCLALAGYGSTLTVSRGPTYVQRQYLGNLDWTLMTYAAIAGLSYALAYQRESQERAIKAAHLEARLARPA